jgi:putative hydrolases of HD superfamily
MDEATRDRLHDQLAFLLEADALKRVLRRNPLADGSRRENSAEHSWHLALFALVLAEHAAEPLDICRVVRLLLVHDLVEIDAGDTFAYDEEAHRDKAEREGAAAERLFALLPGDQDAELRRLWEEFEARDTPEALFAHAVDRLQPILLNAAGGGGTWREHDVTLGQVRANNRHRGAGAPDVWDHAQAVLPDAVDRGLLVDRGSADP